MSMTVLFRYSSLMIDAHFSQHDFFCKCKDFTDSNHPFDDSLIAAAQAIMDFKKYPVIIYSSYRTELCNKNCGGASNSYYLLGKALDLYCGSTLDLVTSDIVAKDPLYRSLRQCGINGFDISPNVLHNDTRVRGSSPDPEFGPYSLWYY